MANLACLLLFAFCLVGAIDARPQIDGRIVGGFPAREAQFPYAAALYLNMTGSGEFNFCGGSLISPSYVLTAAHCVVVSQEITVVLGSTVLNVSTPERVMITVPKENFIVPENYTQGVFDWDLALLKLPEPVELTGYIRTIALDEGHETYAGELAMVLGWGIQWGGQTTIEQNLRYAENIILSNNQCGKNNPTFQEIVRESHICQSTIGYRGACHGDSGGPLVVDGVVMVGLVSFGIDNCFIEYPVGYTRISTFREWIRENSGV